MKQSLRIVALLFGAALAQPVFGDTYSIDFTTISGSPAPTGSFTYDASAPLGSQFTGFVVDWYGYSIDLTSSANALLCMAPVVVAGIRPPHLHF